MRKKEYAEKIKEMPMKSKGIWKRGIKNLQKSWGFGALTIIYSSPFFIQ
jgi:hypothetical protein